MSSSLFGQPVAGGLFGQKPATTPSPFGSSAPAANGAAGATAGGSGGSGGGLFAPKKPTEGGSSLFGNAQTSAPSTTFGQKPPADNSTPTGLFAANNKPPMTSALGGADSTKGSEKAGSLFGGSTAAGTSTTSTSFGGGTGFGGAPSNDA